MKRLIGVLVAALALVAIACIETPEKPEKPVCPVGQIETSPAVWHPATTGDCPVETFKDSRQVVDVEGHYIYADKVNEPVWVDTTYKVQHRDWIETTYKQVKVAKVNEPICPSQDSKYNSTNSTKLCSRYLEHPTHAWRYTDKVDNYVCPAGSTPSGNKCYKTEVDVIGHWTAWVDGKGTGSGVYEEQTVVDVAGRFVDNFVCPAGYDLHSGVCRKFVDTTYKTETFGPISVPYGKSSDPNHCHRPTGVSLGVPSWAMSEFNKLPELLDPGVGTAGYWDPPTCKTPDPKPVDCVVSGWSEWSVCTAGSQTRTRTVTTPASNGGVACPLLVEEQACTVPIDPIYGCMNPAATNYDPLATVDDQSCQYPPDPIYTFEYKSTCDAFFYAIFKDGGEYGSGSGPWGTSTTLFIVIRGDEHQAVAQPLGGDVVVGSMTKPTDCEQPEPTPEPKKECKMVQQPYGMAELFGPNGQRGLMYIYPDPKTGELPGAVGVQRQLCVLGYEAVREGYFGFVYRNSCTGVYTWNGMDVTPRPDVLKHGICARNGACVK